MSLHLGEGAWRWSRTSRAIVIGVPFAFLLVFFLLPFVSVLTISFSEPRMAVPPYAPVIQIQDGVVHVLLNLEHFWTTLTDRLYLDAYLYSIEIAGLTTVLCLLIGYPACYLIARAPETRRNLLFVLIVLPFWTSYLIRVYAWIGLLKSQGLINDVLLRLHLIDTPLKMYHNNVGLMIGMVYNYLPYLMLPLYASLVKMDLRLIEAASDLGAGPWRAFFTVTLPLSRRAIIASSLLVFIPAVGEFVIPEILGGANSLMIGRVMWDDFFVDTDWPSAAAATVAMVVLLLLPIVWFQRLRQRDLGGAV